MCLLLNNRKTEAARANPEPWVYRYKVLMKEKNNGYYAPYRDKRYKRGWNNSNRKSIGITENEKLHHMTTVTARVGRGIHVYTTLARAKKSLEPFRGDWTMLIVRVKCYIRDLIGVGEDKNEAYMKVFLSKADYDKPLLSKQLKGWDS